MNKGIIAVSVLAFLLALVGCLAQEKSTSLPGYSSDFEIRGPFFSDPELMRMLDCPDEQCSGPFSFARLIQEQTASPEIKFVFQPGENPFLLPNASEILATIQYDLQQIPANADAIGRRLNPLFLVEEFSRVELVGVVNRMDRQFHAAQRESDCGEISLIYRFSYSIRDGKQRSRLPVTMNLVFPATSSSTTCKQVAKLWLDAIEKKSNPDKEQLALDLVSPRIGALAPLLSSSIVRLELNMQAYRKPAGIVQDFGSEAAYVIRVFRWNPKAQLFKISYLPNQIDRNSVLCEPEDAFSLCELKQKNRERLVTFLKDTNTVVKIDAGIYDIPTSLGILSRRAISISPGGELRSANQPYWNSPDPRAQIISDEEIEAAIEAAKSAGFALEFISSPSDFRARLNDGTCSGCHQTRAIAGFHFPGSDRKDTQPANAVYIAGSPHFYGDQPRRIDVLEQIAAGTFDLQTSLTTSFSARPQQKYKQDLQETQLVGGWGSKCTFAPAQTSARHWPCDKDLQCKTQYSGKANTILGSCMPKKTIEIGDALQQGIVETFAFGKDKYRRTFPTPVSRDTRIPSSALPKHPPPGNSYAGAHQEFYFGEDPNNHPSCLSNPPKNECYQIRRDYLTGGFPSGALSMTECLGVPPEATCNLVASSGFNGCIQRIGQGDYDINLCFDYFTSYAAIRACDVKNPCRDDYICVKPMGYTKTNADTLYRNRQSRLKSHKYFKEINKRAYDPKDFGQKKPDMQWLEREDRRGVCIPPYFVFQFRADGHPAPDKDKLFHTTPYELY